MKYKINKISVCKVCGGRVVNDDWVSHRATKRHVQALAEKSKMGKLRFRSVK